MLESTAWHHAPAGRWRQATPSDLGDVGLDLVLPHAVHCWRFMRWEQQRREPYITGVYTRKQAPEAHRLLEGRLSQGKLALVYPN